MFGRRAASRLPDHLLMGTNALYRVAIGAILVYVLVSLVGSIFNFGGMIVQTRRTAALYTRPPKLNASGVELQLRETNRLRLAEPARQDLHCNDGALPWDYVCSFVIVQQPTPTRMHFGVRVNANSIIEYSTVTPIGVGFVPVPTPTPTRAESSAR